MKVLWKKYLEHIMDGFPNIWLRICFMFWGKFQIFVFFFIINGVFQGEN
jgi:hypothetical protein